MNFNVRNSIICEDIRREVGNKSTLVGVYSGDIVVPSVPADISLAFYLELDTVPNDGASIKLRMSGPGSGHAEMSVTIASEDDVSTAVLASPRFTIHITESGDLRLEIGCGDGDLKTIIHKKVLVSDNSETA